ILRVAALDSYPLELGGKPHGRCAQYLFALHTVAEIGFICTGFPARTQIRLGHTPAHGTSFDIGRAFELAPLALAAAGFARTKTLQCNGGLEGIGSLVEFVIRRIARARSAHVVVRF